MRLHSTNLWLYVTGVFMKQRIAVQVFSLSVVVFLANVQCIWSQALPLSRSQLERKQLILARAADYEANIKGLYAQDLQLWSRKFITDRKLAIAEIGRALATKAANVRTAKNLDWDQVKADPEFLDFERQQIFKLINEKSVRGELREWAKTIEEQTRRQMVTLFKQLVAEDLGAVFDESLRSEVVKAVADIPIEMLLVKEANVRQIESTINKGLPAVALSKANREFITSAAKILGAIGGAILAAQSGDPLLKAVAGDIFPVLAEWLATNTLSALDRQISGEPNPAALSLRAEAALCRWRDEELLWRLREILDRFGGKSVDTVESLAQRMNAGR
jgi:hypothetical protein